jgi:hypothetical protein
MTDTVSQDTTCPTDYTPSTADVLRLIGKDGVIVGSIAERGSSSKDVDVVVRLNPKPDGPTSLVFQRVREQFAGHCDSSAIGHLWVNALPLPVEMFATTAWRTGDPEKDAKRILFPQARRKCQRLSVLGVEMFVYTPPAG